MADNFESLPEAQLVGGGITQETPPTKVPHAGAVAGNDAQAAGAPPQQPAQPQMGQPAPEQALPLADLPEVEALPVYADGSDPSRPVNKSPVSAADRLFLAAGNPKGSEAYLKNKFQDVKRDEEGNLVVLDNGVWHRVDPQGYGDRDAWDVTKSIFAATVPAYLKPAMRAMGVKPVSKEEIAEVGKDVLDNIFPAISGAAIGARGGLPGAATGAGIGALAPEVGEQLAKLFDGNEMAAGTLAAPLVGVFGVQGVKRLLKSPGALKGALGQTLALSGIELGRTSLGRLVGTYEATLEEQARDMGLEMLLNMGGETIALGMKPTVQMFQNAVEKQAALAGNRNKTALAKLWSGTTGRPEESFRAALDSPEDIFKETDAALKKVGPFVDPKEANGVLQSTQNNLLREASDEAEKAVASNYRKEAAKVIALIPDNASFSPKKAVDSVFSDLQTAGMGRIDEQGMFRPLTDKEVALKFGVDEKNVSRILAGDTVKSFKEIVSNLNKYAKFPNVQGKVGASKMLELRRAMGRTFRDLESPEQTREVAALVTKIKNDVFKAIGQDFAPHGALPSYIKMNEDFARHTEFADAIKRAVESDNPNATDAMVKRLVSKSGQFTSLKDEVGELAKILPDGGAKLRRIINVEHAKSFVDFGAPLQSGSSAAQTGRAALNLASMIPVVGALSPSNQQAIKSQIRYGGKALNMVKNLRPKALEDLLKNDQAMSSLLITMTEGARKEQELQELLTQQAVNSSSQGGQ